MSERDQGDVNVSLGASLSRLGHLDMFATSKAVVSISTIPGEQEMVLHWATEAFLRSLEFVNANDLIKNEETQMLELSEDSSQYIHGFKLRNLFYDQASIIQVDENNPLPVEKEAAAPSDPRVLQHLAAGMIHGVPSHCYALMKKAVSGDPFFAHICMQPLSRKGSPILQDNEDESRKDERHMSSFGWERCEPVRNGDAPSTLRVSMKEKDAVVPSKRTRRKRVVTTYVPKILSDEEYMQYFSGKEDGVVPRIGMNNNSEAYFGELGDEGRVADADKSSGGQSGPNKPSAGKERKHDLGVTDASRGEAGRFVSSRWNTMRSLSSTAFNTVVELVPGVKLTDMRSQLESLPCKQARLWGVLTVRPAPIVGGASGGGIRFFKDLEPLPHVKEAFIEDFQKRRKDGSKRVPSEFLGLEPDVPAPKSSSAPKRKKQK